MSTQIDNLIRLLELLASQKRDEMGTAWMVNDNVQAALGLSPAVVNDAVSLADSRGYVEVRKVMGTAPYTFYSITINAEGRMWLEEQE